MPFSSGERILLFLHLTRPRDDLYGGFDQAKIARECGIGRTHVPRSLKPLLDQGLVLEDRGRTPGSARKVKTYSLSVTGQQVAKSIMDGLAASKLSLVGPDGIKYTMDPNSIRSLVNDHLETRSLGAIGLPLLLSLESEVMTWDRIEAIAREGDSSGAVDIPAGWTTIDPIVMPEKIIARPEVPVLRKMISENDAVRVTGKPGSGRRTIVARALEEQGLKALWIRRSPGSASVKLGIRSDIIVIVEESGPSPSIILMGSGDIPSDPRDQDWDEDLRSLPLVIIGKEGSDDDLPIIRIGPLAEDLFRTALEELGVGHEMASRLYGVTSGSPGLIGFLYRMKRSERDLLLSGTPDEVLLKVLIDLERSKGVSKD